MQHQWEHNTAEKVIEAAFKASVKNQDPEKISDMLNSENDAVRFWGLNAVLNSQNLPEETMELAWTLVNDSSAANAILASEIMVLRSTDKEKGLEVLSEYLKDDRPWVVLNAAISLRRTGKEVKPLLPVIKEEAEKYYGDKGAGYSSWMYPMFIGFALDQAIINAEKK